VIPSHAEQGISRIQDRRYEEDEADLKAAHIPRLGEANLSRALPVQGKLEECNQQLGRRKQALAAQRIAEHFPHMPERRGDVSAAPSTMINGALDVWSVGSRVVNVFVYYLLSTHNHNLIFHNLALKYHIPLGFFTVLLEISSPDDADHGCVHVDLCCKYRGPYADMRLIGRLQAAQPKEERGSNSRIYH
jgi:hypothetical protein